MSCRKPDRDRQVASKATDGEIDALAHELCGLTDEEIRIVDGQSPLRLSP